MERPPNRAGYGHQRRANVDADRANEDWNEVKDYILRVRRNYRKSSDLVQYLLTNDTFRQRFPDAHRIFAFGASILAVSTACETGFSSASDMKTDKQANLEIHRLDERLRVAMSAKKFGKLFPRYETLKDVPCDELARKMCRAGKVQDFSARSRRESESTSHKRGLEVVATREARPAQIARHNIGDDASGASVGGGGVGGGAGGGSGGGGEGH